MGIGETCSDLSGTHLFLTRQLLSFLSGKSLQSVVYISVRSDKEELSHQVMVTELFGPVDSDGKTSYVAATNADEGVVQPGTPEPAKDGSVV